MAKKTKNTATKITKALSSTNENIKSFYIGDGEDKIEVHYKENLSLIEMTAMVNSVLGFVFLITSEDDDDMEYHPEFTNFAIEHSVINYFTDVVLPANADKAHEFLRKTNIASIVRSYIPDAVEEMTNVSVAAIEYKKQQMLKKSKFDSLLNGITSLISSLNGYTENIKIEDIASQFPDLKEQLSTFLKTSTAEEIPAE